MKAGRRFIRCAEQPLSPPRPISLMTGGDDRKTYAFINMA